MVRTEGKTPTTKVWLFCEGLTEHNYFSKLRALERISRLQIEVHSSHNTDALGVINYAIGYKTNHARDFQEGDHIYCIFDRDQNTATQLEQAKALARDHKCTIIFSNPAFEYWILCHYRYCPTALDNPDLLRTLNDNMPGGYNKNDKEVYTKTLSLKNTAIKHAKQIHKKHQTEEKEIISRDSNPVTTVFEIMQFLEQFKEE